MFMSPHGVRAWWPAPPPCRGPGRRPSWVRCGAPCTGRCQEPVSGGREGHGDHLGGDWEPQAVVWGARRSYQTLHLFVQTNQSPAPSRELTKPKTRRYLRWKDLMKRIILHQIWTLIHFLQSCKRKIVCFWKYSFTVANVCLRIFTHWRS